MRCDVSWRGRPTLAARNRRLRKFDRIAWLFPLGKQVSEFVDILRTSNLRLSEIGIHASDIADVASLKSSILARIGNGNARAVWAPTDFLNLASRDAIDKALQRLVASDYLRRIDRGLYDKPDHNRLTGQASPPDPSAVIDAVARRDKIRVLVDGLTAANDLGLTNAVPAKIVVHADARLNPIRLGNLEILFKPTAASKLYWAGRPAMRLVQALHWLRDTDSVDTRPDLEDKLRDLLHHDKQSKLVRRDLLDGLQALPFWMQDLLRPLLMSGASDA
jgi:hypothetical protein